MTSIQLENISKSYDGKETILDNINLAIEEQEFFVLVGPSGCGKSTLLRMIAGLEAVQAGQIFIEEQNVSQLPPQERKIAMVFQSYALFPHLTVKENILFGLNQRKLGKQEVERRLVEALELTNLEKYSDRKPKNLSGGQRQRVALARAIASKRKICLMDEPLSNLDAELREKMRTQIKELQRKLAMSIVYVTHDQTEAMTMGDRIAVLKEGCIQQIGTPLELYNAPVNRFVAGFIGTPKMNFFALTRLANRLVSENRSVDIPLATEMLALIEQERQVIVGIRPEHLTWVATAGDITGTVLNVEQLGHETIVVFDSMGEKMLAKLEGQHNFTIGSDIHFTVNSQQLHFFDAYTEARIEENVTVLEGCAV